MVGIFFILKNLIEEEISINVALIEGTLIAFMALVVNFFGIKYILNKKYRIVDEKSNVIKTAFITVLLVIVMLVSYALANFNIYKSNIHINALPVYNYSEEMKSTIQKTSKYPVNFAPIPIFNASEATEDDMEKIIKDIKEEEKAIDKELKHKKTILITICIAYALSSLTGLMLALYSADKNESEEIKIDLNSKSYQVSKKILLIILILLILVMGIASCVLPRNEDSEDISKEEIIDNAVALVDVLKVGDYVDYMPDNATYSTNTNNTGYDVQTLTTEVVPWRVLDINEETDEIMIIANNKVNEDIYLNGARGYANGSLELNNICKSLYSNKSLGLEARCLDLDDLKKMANENEQQTSSLRYAYYPYDAEINENDVEIGFEGKEYTKRKAENEYSTVEFFYGYDAGGREKIDENGIKYRIPEIDNPVYVTKTYNKELDFPYAKEQLLKNNGCWLASTYMEPAEYSVRVDYGLYELSSYLSIYKNALVTSSGLEFLEKENAIRPVVIIDSKYTVDDSDATKNGSSKETAYKIIKK